jgi:general secretion pathway protein A
MYTSFFGLNEKPFSITPDPRYLFMSERHGEALAHLVYGVTESGGFVQLTGEVGTGKTTLVRTLLLNRMPDNADVAVVLNPQITANEFLLTICEELGIDVPAQTDSVKALTDALNHHLLNGHAEGRRTILVVDEAQNLAPAVLEQVRLLTNLETAKQKLLQIILIGQPELRELLSRNDLRQLAQRITGRYHLEPLTREETSQYVEHRLRVAGALGEVIDSKARNEVFRLSAGVPRLINVICDRALLGAYAQESRIITKRLIRQAAAEVSGEIEHPSTARRFSIAASLVAVAIIAASLWYAGKDISSPEAIISPPAAEIAAPNVVIASAVETVETVPADVEEPPTLAAELALASGLTTADFALATLFELWGMEYTSGAMSGCEQAAQAGLACLTERGSWSGLRQFNRPAILTVIDDSGNSHQIVLTAINDDYAEVSIGGVSVSHPVNQITDMWFGQFMLLWKPPRGAPVSLSQGSRGAEVIWLRKSLSEIDLRYSTASLDSDIYDAELAGIVREFQRDNRLAVDGLAGKQTLIIINSLLSTDGSPRLMMSHVKAPRLAQE